MRHRDLQSLREFREEEARIEAAKKAQKERREAAEKERRQREREKDRESIARELDRELVLEGARDAHFLLRVPPEMLNIKMPKAEADAFNKREAERFVRECPEFSPFKSPQTAKVFGDYLSAQGANIVSAEMLLVVFERLKSLGLVHKNPTPKPEPVPLSHRPNVPLRIERPAEPQTYVGRDPETGKPREYTAVEVNKMPADEYKKRFEILPTISQLLTEMAAQRGASRS